MTFEDLGLKLKSLPGGEAYKDLPERLLALAFLKANPTYWDLISPEARKIQEVLEFDPNIPTISISDKVDKARQQTELIALKAQAVANLKAIEDMLMAQALNIPVGILAQWKLEEQQLKNQIAFREAEVRLKFEEAKLALELKKLDREMSSESE